MLQKEQPCIKGQGVKTFLIKKISVNVTYFVFWETVTSEEQYKKKKRCLVKILFKSFHKYIIQVSAK